MADSKPGVHVVQLKHVSVPPSMVAGDKFIKWDEDSSLVTAGTLRVDPFGYFLHWTDQNEETQIFDICSIRDTRTGHYAKVPKDVKMRDLVNMGVSQESLEDKTLTVAHGPDFVNISFENFCTSKKEIAKLWTDEILKMAYNQLALNGSVHYFLRKAYVRLTLQADKWGKITLKNIVKSFAKNIDDRRRVEKAFVDSTGLASSKEDAIQLSQFTFDDFYRFYRKLMGRQEVDKIVEELFGTKTYISVDQFVEFLNGHQRDPRLNEVLYPYANPDRAWDLFQQYEPSDPVNNPNGLMSAEGFLRFLLSEDNLIVSVEKFDLSHDMDQPLCHYFVNSSHNTYLTGDQFAGKSSVEIYRQVLLAGCRCVELDFWNGRNDDPIIKHGYTMVPEVPAEEVIEAIAESAFKTSDYPVILSFENHCNAKQQAKIAQYCREYFGDMLLDTPLDNYPLELGAPLPSPSLLKRKIIIKNKKNLQDRRTQHRNFDRSNQHDSSSSLSSNNARLQYLEVSAASLSEDNDLIEFGSESDDEDESSPVPNYYLSPEEIQFRKKTIKDKGTAGKETKAGAEISALVNYVQPVHFHSFEHAERRKRSYEMSSFVETLSTALLKEHPVDFVNYNKRQISRIYPRGTRVDSSNFNPQIFWNVGCQLVALNFQTLDLAMQLNLGIFEMNARTGYLLKPQILRRMDRKFDPFSESTIDGVIAGTVSVQVISGQFISDKRVSTYVEVDMFGLPADSIRKRYRTKTVLNNGLNPVYDQDPFVFPKLILPDLACLRIAVYEDSASGRLLLGHRVLPVTGLCPGYRHISLRNDGGQPLNLSTLFVNIMVKDYVPDTFSSFADALANPIQHQYANALVNPIQYQFQLEKRSKQLSILTEDMDDFLEEPVRRAFEESENRREVLDLFPENTWDSSSSSIKPRIVIDQNPFIDQEEAESIVVRGEGASSSAAFKPEVVYIGSISSIDNKLAIKPKESRLSTKRLFKIFNRKK